jgi:hypothetical protein
LTKELRHRLSEHENTSLAEDFVEEFYKEFQGDLEKPSILDQRKLDQRKLDPWEFHKLKENRLL